MYPVFFSVSNHDVAFADDVWTAFPDDWIYLYSKTGRHGAKMWDEIALNELPGARVFVIFWSANYLSSPGCVREVEQASELYSSGSLKPIIIRLDDHPLHWKDGMDPAKEAIFRVLKPLTEYRASVERSSTEAAKALVAQEIEPVLQSDHPRIPRHSVAGAFRKSLQRDSFTLIPAAWVSGFNGVGRESLIRSVYRDFAPNGRGIVIEVNEATLPLQLYLRIESEAFGASIEKLTTISNQVGEGNIEKVAEAIERNHLAGNFLILRHGRVVQDEIELPEWLDEVAALLVPSTRPKLFIVSQQPLIGDRLLRNRNYLVSFRTPTIEEHELTEFCYHHIGYFDSNPTRWLEKSDDAVTRIV